MTTASLLDGGLARRLERLRFVTRRRFLGHGQGDRRSLRRGSSLEFADYRHYAPGDEPGRVDWNIYARTDALFVRLYEEEEVLNVHLLLDASRSMDWGTPNKLAYTRQLAAALGYLALHASNRLHVWPLMSAQGSFGPAWGRERATPLVAFLDRLRPKQTSSPLPGQPGAIGVPNLGEAVITEFSSRSVGLTILISDLLSSSWETALRHLAARPGDGLVIHVLAPNEVRPELGGDARLIDRETGATVSVTLNSDALRLYGERLRSWREAIETFCTRHGLNYVPADTSLPVESLVFHTLRRRGVIR